MKPVASTMTEVDNLPGEVVNFSISPANSAWIMRSMADLYSNRELACIREYSTNAYDSNKEKALRDGHDIKPIKVLLPSAMNPTFEVSDSGVGMSEQELKEVYTQFGESTKRDSDDFNGMLGFGSKSAVAYTNTFTVTSVKNGRKVVAVITRREDAMGGYLVSLKIVLNVPTDEDNGVAIQIPVHNWREFEQKAKDFYRFWEPGTVLVNGREPEWAVGEKIDDNLYYYPSYGQSYVVMGNVPYRIENPDALFPRGMNRISFVAYVPMGTVEFTPSREDLKYSEHTKRNLHKIIDDFSAKAKATADAEIKAAKSHAEAFNVYTKWATVIGVQNLEDLTYKGAKVTAEFPIDGMRYSRTESRYNTYHVNSWYLKDMYRTIIVTGFPAVLAAHHKAKAREWYDIQRTKDSSFGCAYFIFIAADKVTNPWVDQSRVVSWEQMKSEIPKKPAKPRVQNVAWGRKAGSFDLITANGLEGEQDVPHTKELYYITVTDYNAQENRSNIYRLLKEFKMDHKIVKVPGNRKDKFLRHYPHAKPIMEKFKSMIILDGPSLISDDGMTILKTDNHDQRILTALDESKVDDPQIRKLVRIFKLGEAHHTAEYRRHYMLATMLNMGGQFKRHKYEYSWDRDYKPVTKEYPLANVNHLAKPEHAKHVYVYLNAVYAARKDGKNV